MKPINFIKSTLLFIAATAMTSCGDSSNNIPGEVTSAPTVVSVCPQSDGSFFLKVGNNVLLKPENVKNSPFGTEEVRALASYIMTGKEDSSGKIKIVKLTYLDKIPTFLPSETTEDNDVAYGKDPFSMDENWMNMAEDGYLTFYIRAYQDNNGTRHSFSLVKGANPNDPNEFELRHNAYGDVNGVLTTFIVAFNLNKLGYQNTIPVKIRYKSYDGERAKTVQLQMRDGTPSTEM